MNHEHRVHVVLGGVLLSAGLAAFAGCGGDDNPDATAAGIVSAGAASSPSANADQPESLGTASPTATEGLPDGFPVDDVPLLDEQVLTGSAGGPDGEFAWSVVQQSSRAVDEVSAQVRKEYIDAGYKAEPGNDMDDLSVMQFTGAKYEVGVTAARTEGRVVVTYVVRDLG